MTIRELKEILEDFRDDDIVVFKPERSDYVEDFSNEAYENYEVRAFYGDNYNAVVLCSGGQTGAI